MKDRYKTLELPSEGLYRAKGSKFIARAFPVADEEEIKTYLDDLRKEYHDARHHCYAWRLDPEGSLHRSNDDGEPSGSAGKPILGQLRSFDVTQALVVVIRYFGGTLLGVGGLIQAYKGSHCRCPEKGCHRGTEGHVSTPCTLPLCPYKCRHATGSGTRAGNREPGI
ncbi:MAG: YigZ family protein [Bacteroidales bacterium]